MHVKMSKGSDVDLLFSLTEKAGKKRRASVPQTQVNQACSVPAELITNTSVLDFVLYCVLKKVTVRTTRHTLEVR